ncbi:hypothetical protein H9P43_006831 [Blastocladiella emersonii ATCC 22665]|nr:hypothetical protein H9P43_006831 [Blastocladiella emersonii ATCC 22665]
MTNEEFAAAADDLSDVEKDEADEIADDRSAPASPPAVVIRPHVDSLFGKVGASGGESLAHLLGAYVLYRILNLLNSMSLRSHYLDRVRDASRQSARVLETVMRTAGSADDHVRWARELGGPPTGRTALAREIEIHEQARFSLFLAAVADNVKEAFGCGGVFIHPEATKAEIVSALIHTTNHSLMTRARRWYRALVYDDKDYPAWLADDGSKSAAWKRLAMYAKVTPLLFFMRRDGMAGGRHDADSGARTNAKNIYPTIQGVLDAAAACRPGDLLGRSVDIPPSMIKDCSRAIPMLGLRVPETRQKMVDLVREVIVNVADPLHEIVLELTLDGPDAANVIFVNADVAARPPIVAGVLDWLRERKSACSSLARPQPASARTAVAGVNRHRKKLPSDKVEAMRVAAAIRDANTAAAASEIRPGEGPCNWSEFVAWIHLLGSPPNV